MCLKNENDIYSIRNAYKENTKIILFHKPISLFAITELF